MRLPRRTPQGGITRPPAGPAADRARVDRTLGKLVPPLLLLRRPDLGTAAVDTVEFVIPVEQGGRRIGVVRRLSARVGRDGIARDPGLTSRLGLAPGGILALIAR